MCVCVHTDVLANLNSYRLRASGLHVYLYLPHTAVAVGALPNLEHGIGGSLEIITTTRILLKDFSYDGLGPG